MDELTIGHTKVSEMALTRLFSGKCFDATQNASTKIRVLESFFLAFREGESHCTDLQVPSVYPKKSKEKSRASTTLMNSCIS